MAIHDAFDKRLHLAELAEPLETQEGVLTPSVRRGRALQNLFNSATAGVIAFNRAVLASAGSTVADAAVVASQFTIVTGADGAKGVALPAAAATEGPYFIYNDAANSLIVYPVNGGNDNINGLAEDAGFRVGGGELAIFIATSATQWYVPTVASALNPQPLTRSTVSNAATISAAQMRGGILFQDASAGVQTMTTRTGTLIAGDFPEMRIGDSIDLFVASNHATNTSTISGGATVTLVGSGAVVNTGGAFKLIKTGATAFDLVRVG